MVEQVVGRNKFERQGNQTNIHQHVTYTRAGRSKLKKEIQVARFVRGSVQGVPGQ
jgi:hypothetical protein